MTGSAAWAKRHHRLDDLVEHRLRQHAGLNVVARRVVAGHDLNHRIEPVDRTMRERRRCQSMTEGAHRRLVCNPAKRQDDLGPGCGQEFIDQKTSACRHLGRRWLVLRRHAAGSIGDARIKELEPIAGISLVGAPRQAEPGKRTIEDVARKISGERTTGTIGTAQSWRQPDHEDRRIGRAKGWNRGVMPTRKLLPVDVAKGCEAGAERAVG